MANLEHTITLTVGDWSGDGHDKTDVIVFKTNKTANEIEQSYHAAVKMTNLDLKAQCKDYEDSQFKPEFVKACMEIFANQPDAMALFGDEDSSYVEEGGDMYVESEQFAELYLFIARMMLSDLEWQVQSNDYSKNINVGGYGLFWS